MAFMLEAYKLNPHLGEIGCKPNIIQIPKCHGSVCFWNKILETLRMSLKSVQSTSSTENETVIQYNNNCRINLSCHPGRILNFTSFSHNVQDTNCEENTFKNKMKNLGFIFSLMQRRNEQSQLVSGFISEIGLFVVTHLRIKYIGKPWEFERIRASAYVSLFTFAGRTIFPTDNHRGPLEHSQLSISISVLIKYFNLLASPCCSFSDYEAH